MRRAMFLKVAAGMAISVCRMHVVSVLTAHASTVVIWHSEVTTAQAAVVAAHDGMLKSKAQRFPCLEADQRMIIACPGILTG